jgi:hypothetical protein
MSMMKMNKQDNIHTNENMSQIGDDKWIKGTNSRPNETLSEDNSWSWKHQTHILFRWWDKE